MAKVCVVASALVAGASWCFSAAPPQAEIAGADMRVRVYLPDATNGFYRGTRFDWAGMIGSVQHDGHDYFPQWFERVDPAAHDFTYDGGDIVASPCTAATGPAEEFSTNRKGLGFDEAKAGGTFIKIGVGVLRKPDDEKYDAYRLYPIADGGRWTVIRRASAVEVRQELADPATGYAYEYRKTISVATDKSEMTLEHALRNRGKRVISTSVYNHNFLYLDRRPPGPDFTVQFPFLIRSTTAANSLARVGDREITFSKEVAGEESVYLDIQGFGSSAKDYDFRIENRAAGAGVRIVGDRPLSRLALWSIRAPLSLEPFIEMKIEPGQEHTWRIRYEFYTAGSK